MSTSESPPLHQVGAEQVHLDTPVVLPLVPLAEVAGAKAIGPGLVGEQGDAAALRPAVGVGLFRPGLSRPVEC